MDYTLHTFGNGEILKGVFDALANCLNAHSGSLYTALIRISLIIGGLWAALYALYGDYMRAITHWIIPMTMIMQLLFVPQATVWIIDPVSRYHQKVDHVPYGLAMMAGMISTLGFVMTQQVERFFSLPDDFKYQRSGALFASHLLQEAKTFRITNEELAENMRQFVGQCVAYDVLLGSKYSLEDLRHSPNIWELVSSKASPARSFLWQDLRQGRALRSRPEIITCAEGIKRFDKVWRGETQKVASLFGTKLFSKKSLLNPSEELRKHLSSAYRMLTDMGQSAEEILKQNMMIYAVVDGIEQKSTRLGNAPNFAVRRAYLQQRATYETLGALAAETLPTMKAVLEAIAYACFLFVIPLAILPFGYRFLSSWLQILVWLQMWAPLYAVLNYIMTMAARAKSLSALALSNADGITIANSVGLANVNADMAAMAGYLAMSIPFLCIALVKGVGTFVQMASHVGHVSQSAAGQAAGDALSGNYSFGNISMGNRQMANTSMLSHSNAASYRSGSFHQADGQSEVITTPDGQQILNIKNSNLPISLNVAENLISQRMERAGKSYQKGLNESEIYFESLVDALRKSVDLADYWGKSKQSSTHTTQNTSLEKAQGTGKTVQSASDVSKSNNLSTRRSAEISIGFGGVASTLLKALGIDIKLSLSGSADKQTIYSKAQKAMQSKDVQKTLRQIKQDIQNNASGRTDDESKKLIEAINQALDKAAGSRKEAMKNFREAEDYTKEAAYLKSHASVINANYNQQYTQWLSEQPDPSAGGRPFGLRGVAKMIANDPTLAMFYANRFLEEKGLAPYKATELAGDVPARLRKDYQHDNRHAFIDLSEEGALSKIKDLREKGIEQGLGPVKDEGLEEGFAAKEDEMNSQIGAQEKKIEQEYEDKLYKHHRESRKSLIPQAGLQGLKHGWDVGTHAVDLVRGDKPKEQEQKEK